MEARTFFVSAQRSLFSFGSPTDTPLGVTRSRVLVVHGEVVKA